MMFKQQVIEAFGAGTAAVVAPVKGFHFKGTDYDIPLNPDKPAEEAGPLAQNISDVLTDIQYGREEHPVRFLFYLRFFS